MIKAFKCLVGLFALGALSLQTAFAAASNGNCQKAATSLSVSAAERTTTVTLVRGWDQDSGTWSGETAAESEYVRWYKVTLTKGKAYSFWATDTSNENIWMSVETDWDDDIYTSFEEEMIGVDDYWYVDADGWDEDDPSSCTFYIGFGGGDYDSSKTITLHIQQTDVENVWPAGCAHNPETISVTTEGSVTRTTPGKSGEYYFRASLKADGKYKFIRTAQEASKPSIDIEPEPDEECHTPKYEASVISFTESNKSGFNVVTEEDWPFVICLGSEDETSVTLDYKFAEDGSLMPVDPSEGVKVGEWNSNFTSSKAYAEQNHLPYIVFCGADGCGYCELMSKSLAKDEYFLSWQKKRRVVLCYINPTGSYTEDQKFAEQFTYGRLSDGSYEQRMRPGIAFYQMDDTGGSTVLRFTGRNGSMPIGESTDSLARQLADSADQYFKDSFSKTMVVSFDVGGFAEPIEDTLYDVGQPFGTLFGMLPVPDSETKSFEGWTNAVGEVVTKDTLAPENDLTLYAVWGPKKWTVTFDANGALGAVPDPMREFEGTVTNVPACTLTRPGFKYQWWKGDSGIYTDGDEYVFRAANETLVAQWTYTVDGLDVALDREGLALMCDSEGDAPWQVCTTEKKIGVSSAQTCALADGKYSKLEATVTVPDSKQYQISFYYKTSTEAGRDIFTAKVDGIPVVTASGDKDWTLVKQTITGAGAHTVTFLYEKNASGKAGEDCVWVDGFRMDPMSLVTFDAQGGEAEYDSAYYAYGTDFDGNDIQLGAVPGCSRTLFDFLGWYDGELIYVAESAAPDYDLELTAKWGPKKWIVSFDANGASGSIPEPMREFEGTVTNVPGPGELRKSGYEFVVWKGESGVYAAGDTYTFSAADETLVAQWSFSTNGIAEALGCEDAVYAMEGDAPYYPYVTGEKCVVSGEIGDNQTSTLSATVEGTGVVAFEWSVSSEWNHDTFQFFIDGVLMDAISGERDWLAKEYSITNDGVHVLSWTYAKDQSNWDGKDCGWIRDLSWTQVDDTVTVSFDECGGEKIFDTQEYSFGDVYADLPIPTWDDRTFAGWYTLADGGELVENGDIVRFNSPVLYAHWIRQDLIDIVDPNGRFDLIEFTDEGLWSVYNPYGSTKYAQWEADSQNQGSRVDLMTAYFTTERDAYVAIAWNGGYGYSVEIDGEYVDEMYVNGEYRYAVEGAGEHEIKLCFYNAYSWYYTTIGKMRIKESPDSFAVAFDACGGSCEETSRNYAYGAVYGDLPVPTLAGCTFLGWSQSRYASECVSADDVAQFTSPTLYAQWELDSVVKFLGEDSGIAFTTLTDEKDWSLRSQECSEWNSETLSYVDRCYSYLQWNSSPYVEGGVETVVFEGTMDGPGQLVIPDILYGNMNVLLYVDGVAQTNYYQSGSGTYGEERYYANHYNWYDSDLSDKFTCLCLAGGPHSVKLALNATADKDTGSECGYIRIGAMRWEPAPAQVEVAFDANGGSWSWSGAQTQTVEYAVGCVYGSIPRPTRVGCQFVGWYTSKYFGSKISATDHVDWTAPTLYAHWTSTIEAALGGGVSDAYVSCDGIVSDGNGVVFPIPEQNEWDYEISCDTNRYFEVTCEGEAIVSFDWSVDGEFDISDSSARMKPTFSIDGEEVCDSFSSERGNSVDVGVASYFWVGTNRVTVSALLSPGTHVLRWSADILEAYRFSEVRFAVENFKIVEKPVANRETLFDWGKLAYDYLVWKPGNLTYLLDKYTQRINASASDYDAHIWRALTKIAILGENATAREIISRCGYAVADYTFKPAGEFVGLERAPLSNDVIDEMTPEIISSLESALADVKAIPEDWTGRNEIHPEDYGWTVKTNSVFKGEPIYYGLAEVSLLRAGIESALACVRLARGYDYAADYIAVSNACEKARAHGYDHLREVTDVVPKLMSIRKPAELLAAKENFRAALQSIKRADRAIWDREDYATYILEYDLEDREEIVETRKVYDQVLASLDATNKVDIAWFVNTYDSNDVVRANAPRGLLSRDLFLGALFAGTITRDLVPDAKLEPFSVNMDTVKDFTIGGLFPDVTFSEVLSRIPFSQTWSAENYAAKGSPAMLLETDQTFTLTGVAKSDGDIGFTAAADGAVTYSINGVSEDPISIAKGAVSSCTVSARDNYSVSYTPSVALTNTATATAPVTLTSLPSALTDTESGDGPYTETVDGISWTFIVENGEAKLGSTDYANTIPQATEGSVVIPDELGGCPVTEILDSAFYACAKLTKVVIPESVCVIESGAFLRCKELRELDFLCDRPIVGDGAFSQVFASCQFKTVRSADWAGVTIPGTWQGYAIGYLPWYDENLTVTADKGDWSTFVRATTVTLTAPVGCAIYYTLDGSEPTTNSAKYAAPIALNATMTVTYFAFETATGDWGPIDSVTLLRATGEDKTIAVTPSVADGTRFLEDHEIAFADADAKTVWYTLDGSDPRTSGSRQKYEGPFTLSETATVRYYAVDGETGDWGEVKSVSYLFPSYDETLAVTSDPTADATFSGSTTVSLSAPGGCTIHYTTDGSTVTKTNSVYSEPIAISATTTVKFMAVKDATQDWGPIGAVVLTRVAGELEGIVVTPSLTNGTQFVEMQDVELSAADGQTIWYTTDGSDPRTSSTRTEYDGSITLERTTTLKYYAVEDETGDWGSVQTVVCERIYDQSGSENEIVFASVRQRSPVDGSVELTYEVVGANNVPDLYVAVDIWGEELIDEPLDGVSGWVIVSGDNGAGAGVHELVLRYWDGDARCYGPKEYFDSDVWLTIVTQDGEYVSDYFPEDDFILHYRRLGFSYWADDDNGIIWLEDEETIPSFEMWPDESDTILYYTVDGTTPNSSSPRNDERESPILIEHDMTIKVLAVDELMGVTGQVCSLAFHLIRTRGSEIDWQYECLEGEGDNAVYEIQYSGDSGNLRRRAVGRFAIQSNGERITSLGDDLFRSCDRMTEFIFPSGLTDIGNGTFERCTRLSHIELPEGLLSIGDNAFRECASLAEVTIPASVTNIGYFAFRDCLRLTNVTLLGTAPRQDLGVYMGVSAFTVISGRLGAATAIVYAEITNATEEITVPENWLDEIATAHDTPAGKESYQQAFEEKFGSDLKSALTKPTGKHDLHGNPLQVWQDYVAGTDPLDEEDKFTATVTIEDGVPKVRWEPELPPERAAMRKYTTYGATALGGGWTDVSSMSDAERKAGGYQFFKVTVEMR